MIWFEEGVEKESGCFIILHGRRNVDVGKVAICYSKDIAKIIVDALEKAKILDKPSDMTGY